MPACLIVESGDARPKMLELYEDQTYFLGRHPGNHLVVEDRHASRTHACLSASNGVWIISDEKATNGTLVNETRIKSRTALSQGDRIQIGSIHLRFHERIPENPLATLDPLALSSSVPSLPGAVPASSSASSSGSFPVASPVSYQSGEETHLATTHNTAVHSIATLLEHDDVSVLLAFTNASLRDESPQALIRRALEVLGQQTRANMVAYVPVDPDLVEQRILWPDEPPSGLKVSRRLNQVTVDSARPIWLSVYRQNGGVESESLRETRDALCIPLFGRQPDRECLGTFHLYRSKDDFQINHFRFAETMGLIFASNMRSLRDRLALQAENTRLRESPANVGRLIGSSAIMTSLRERILHMARAQFPVLILGEPGVGKQLVAEMIHQQSNRRHYSLVRVDCALLTGGSGARQLFSESEKAPPTGTGPSSYLNQAEMGILLLDDVGRLVPSLQERLLRLLEARQSSLDEKPRLDVRILATSSQDLVREIREGRFLAELYYRFVGLLQVPALREHASDIPEMVAFFLDLLQRQYHTKVTLEPAALERLQRCSWPGNARQLRTILEVAVASKGPSGVIRAEDLAFSDERPVTLEVPPSLNLGKLEEWAIKQALAQTEGNKTQAAKILGIHRETLGLKMKQYQLPEG